MWCVVEMKMDLIFKQCNAFWKVRVGKRQMRSIPIIELYQEQQPATPRLFICALWARAIATWLGRLLLAQKETGSQSLLSYGAPISLHPLIIIKQAAAEA